MTFRKTQFNGLQVDYMNDRLRATTVMSRVSQPVVIADPNPFFVDNYTNVLGMRAVFDVSDTWRIGATLVNGHNGRSGADRFGGNPLKGRLTTGQLEDRINRIVIRISDDSPEDGEGAPTLYASDVEITTRLGDDRDTLLVGSQVGLRPRVEGGIVRDGFPVAEGDPLLLEYILSSPDPDVVDLEELIDDVRVVDQIKRVRFRVLLSNDYRIEVTSDRQTDNRRTGPQPQFLTVDRAAGNVKDDSNQRWVVFDYGFPTATQVAGVTLETDDLAGFRVYAELNINHQFRQYPSINRERHTSTSGIEGDRFATGWMVHAARSFHPFFVFGEAFGIDHDYNTTLFMVDGSGRINYADTQEARSTHLYDLVDDNDDNDRINDRKRLFDDGRSTDGRGTTRGIEGFGDDAVFPGLDQNNDFISDFNQNDTPVRPNLLPDYAEPFLRHRVDRPEFLFGIDLNNNGWGDRFENDDESDYPYRRDRRGFNSYAGSWILPDLKLTVGHKRVSQPSTGREDRTSYALMAFERSLAGIGTVTAYDSFKLVRDEIPDDVIQWIEPRVALGRSGPFGGAMQPVADPLALRNSVVNKVWLGYSRLQDTGVNTVHKLVFELIHQRDDAPDDVGLSLPTNSRRFGLIDKIDHVLNLGRLRVEPRLKSELFFDDTPFDVDRLAGRREGERSEWTGIAGLMVDLKFLKRSRIEFGLEQLAFRDLAVDEVAASADQEGLLPGDVTGDYNQTSIALQLTVRSAYLGYGLVTQMGFRVDRRRVDRFRISDRTDLDGLSFVSVYAGLGD